MLMRIAPLLALVFVCGCKSTNRVEYQYEFGRVRGIDQGALMHHWRFGFVEKQRGSEPPKVFVGVSNRLVRLSDITPEDLKKAGAEQAGESSGDVTYLLGSSIFIFEGNRLSGWQVGPHWDQKQGPEYSRGPGHERHRFPLVDREVRELFGEPAKVSHETFVL